MSVNAAVQPSLSPNWWQRPEKQRRVYRKPPESRPRHRGSCNNGAGAMGTPNKRGLFGNSACRVGTGGRCCCVTVCDSTMGGQEGGYGTTATGGGTAGWRRSLQ